MWRRIDGQERICTTYPCSREPSWCLDVDGVASVYCDRCKKQIDFTVAAAADEEKHGGDCNAGALAADPQE